MAPAFPGYFDQAVSLQAAYQAYDESRTAGAASAVRGLAARDHPMGLLLPAAGLAAFLAAGPSRLAALAVGFAAFALLQVVVVLVVRRLVGWPAALLAWGLTWALRSAYLPAGGVADFRSDFTALCLYAVFLGCALRGNALESPRWSALAGLAAAGCVWARFLTVVYVAGALGAFAVAMLIRSRLASEPDRPAARARGRGALLAAAVTIALSAPGIWLQREPIAAHYLRGILGPMRAARAQVVGADRPLANLAFYPHSLLGHAGPILAGLAVLLALALAVERLRGARWSGSTRAGALLVALAFAVPLAVLTGLTSKSIVVGGILAAPLLWAVPLAAARLLRGRTAVAWALAGLVAAAGATVQWRAWRVRPFPVPPADVEGVRVLHDAIASECRSRGWTEPAVSIDHVSDALHGTVVDVSTYERTGRWLHLRTKLGSSIGTIGATDAVEAARGSDFVVLTTRGPETPGPYPADRSLEAARPDLRAYCEAGMRSLGRFRAPGRDVEVFSRR